MHAPRSHIVKKYRLQHSWGRREIKPRLRLEAERLRPSIKARRTTATALFAETPFPLAERKRNIYELVHDLFKASAPDSQE
jgi:hypothetical protein